MACWRGRRSKASNYITVPAAALRSAARRNGAKLPVTALVDQFYGDVQDMGGNRWDTSALIQRLRKN